MNFIVKSGSGSMVVVKVVVAVFILSIRFVMAGSERYSVISNNFNT